MGRSGSLRVEGLCVDYGQFRALHEVSLTVEEGEMVALIGSNGAGKSTLLRAISGLIPWAAGSVTFGERSLRRLAPQAIVRLGLAHVPEGRRVFPGMTVLENLQVAAYALGYPQKQVEEDLERVLEIFPPLRQRSRSYAWSLSGGEQQMLVIGRGLMARPRILLLDEPSLGLAPRLVDEVFDIILDINSRGTTILLVEQNANVALGVSRRAYVMELGRVVLEGPSRDLADLPLVKAAYLGRGD